ncbi:winged helix-turn-helix domain-containing protein [Paenibacillus sp. JX-17]|uniref:Winged helix-turn-helix domain-containing protein n=1 Tax=Paenibacillus lacisoli TaxID=3064525 RepID=A0ABT9CDL2_9BACL|nr:winged helix-turn-helix domain-containing protein [Paenibacillus sp. JX-17]MDO7907341.1 winged helix-turn-helix domain-containing protein [Paenibacillus sp. JX-17]
MLEIMFNPDGYVVTDGTRQLQLLPKEYALLQFLYFHRNQAFTRTQLLEQVWPLEYPVDRTVDDHIYRLRKKLGSWPGIAINTVRGYGYILTVSVSREEIKWANPSTQDKQMEQAIAEMLSRYHLFGQGHSMQALLAQQEVLGVRVDNFYRIYIRFIRGDSDPCQRGERQVTGFVMPVAIMEMYVHLWTGIWRKPRRLQFR